ATWAALCICVVQTRAVFRCNCVKPSFCVRSDPATYIGGEAGRGRSFWNLVGWATWLVFLPVLLPFVAVKYRQRRREFASLAQVPGVTGAKVSVIAARRLGMAFSTAGWSYTISDTRVAVYHGPLVQVVERSNLTGVELDESSDGDLKVTLGCRTWND